MRLTYFPLERHMYMKISENWTLFQLRDVCTKNHLNNIMITNTYEYIQNVHENRREFSVQTWKMDFIFLHKMCHESQSSTHSLKLEIIIVQMQNLIKNRCEIGLFVPRIRCVCVLTVACRAVGSERKEPVTGTGTIPWYIWNARETERTIIYMQCANVSQVAPLSTLNYLNLPPNYQLALNCCDLDSWGIEKLRRNILSAATFHVIKERNSLMLFY